MHHVSRKTNVQREKFVCLTKYPILNNQFSIFKIGYAAKKIKHTNTSISHVLFSRVMTLKAFQAQSSDEERTAAGRAGLSPAP